MKKNDFNDIGVELYGNNWKTDMSKNMGISRRQVIRYSNGESVIPEKWEKFVILLLNKKIKSLKKMVDIVSK